MPQAAPSVNPSALVILPPVLVALPLTRRSTSMLDATRTRLALYPGRYAAHDGVEAKLRDIAHLYERPAASR